MNEKDKKMNGANGNKEKKTEGLYEIRTFSREETAETGTRLGRLLKAGDVVCLAGDLGAGKTVFAGGIAAALGVDGYVTSPTFTIVNEYEGKIPLYHFDVYRISSPDEMFEIGFEEYLDGRGVVIIEWAELIRELLPSGHIWVDIRKDLPNGCNARIIKMEFKGDKYRHLARQMEA